MICARILRQATVWPLVHALLFLPLAMVSLRAGIEQAPPELDEAAKALGSSPVRLFGRAASLLAGDRKNGATG